MLWALLVPVQDSVSLEIFRPRFHHLSDKQEEAVLFLAQYGTVCWSRTFNTATSGHHWCTWLLPFHCSGGRVDWLTGNGRWSHQWSYFTLSPVSTEIGDHSWVYHLGMQPVNQANLPWEMSTSQGALAVPCRWEDNHWSGITLDMHPRLCGIPTYRLNGLRMGDKPHLQLWGDWHPLSSSLSTRHL